MIQTILITTGVCAAISWAFISPLFGIIRELQDEYYQAKADLELVKEADRLAVVSHNRIIEQYHKELASQKQLLKEAYGKLNLLNGTRKPGEAL